VTPEEALEELKRRSESYEDRCVDSAIRGVESRAERRERERDEREQPAIAGESAVSRDDAPSSVPADPIVDASDLQVYDFVEPAEIAQLFNPEVTLHNWQLNISHQIASAKPTQHDTFKLCLCACNGSGKDAFVIAPFVVWFCLTRKRALTVITSSSGVQLTAQTENYISALALKFNKLVGRECFKVIKRFIKCNDTGSEVRLFATDEPGKAEGYHPLESWSEMAVITNEAKSIHDEIFEALTRCTGYNYWLEVSTPGEPTGHFHYSCTNHERLGYKFTRVTSYDCSHKNPKDIEEDRLRYGENSAIFRSKHLALFTQLGGQFIISQLWVNKCVEKTTSWIGKRWQKRVGIDIAMSTGGDESVLSLWQGNKRLAQHTFCSDDITVIVTEIDTFLRKHGIALDSTNIYIDDSGVGRAVWPLLRDKGWVNVNRVLNQARAYNTAEFDNRGTELWFLIARLVEECYLILPKEDHLLVEQLSTRKYDRSKRTGKIRMQTKLEMRSEGYKSPDRADAMVLAFTGLTIENFQEAVAKGDVVDIESTKVTGASHALTSKELIEFTISKPKESADFIAEFVKPKEAQAPNLVNVIQEIYDYSN